MYMVLCCRLGNPTIQSKSAVQMLQDPQSVQAHIGGDDAVSFGSQGLPVNSDQGRCCSKPGALKGSSLCMWPSNASGTPVGPSVP